VKDKIQTDHLVLARRIRSAGCPIFIAEDDGEARCIPSDELRVSQTGSVIESTAFVWGHGTGFQIHLIITSNKSTFAVSRLKLELPWKEDQLMWLEDPEEIGGASRCYRFCGDRILEFERNQVMNHRLRVTRPFSSGESVSGYLLGLGSEPIPQAFPHGKMIPAFLILHDQFGRVFRAGVELWTDRHPHAPLRRGLEVRREGGLLDKRDVVVDS
jgi:hypothetical protein